MSPPSPSRRKEREFEAGRPPLAPAGELECTGSQDEASVAITESARSKIEVFEKELLLVRLRRADVLKRIRALRQAVSALVKVFGPSILDRETPGAVQVAIVPYRGQAAIDVCREILRESPHSLSFGRILNLVRHRAPAMLAEFQNPGVAISNALRTLQRRGEVEHSKSGDRGKWRWTEKQGPRIGSHARHPQWPTPSQLAEGQFMGGEEPRIAIGQFADGSPYRMPKG